MEVHDDSAGGIARTGFVQWGSVSCSGVTRGRGGSCFGTTSANMKGWKG